MQPTFKHVNSFVIIWFWKLVVAQVKMHKKTPCTPFGGMGGALFFKKIPTFLR